MGHNPTKNPFRRARLGLDTQAAVDEYKARSVWGMWWQLDEKVRRRYFMRPERDFVTRWGARLDELACLRDNPTTDGEHHFVQVCLGHEDPLRAPLAVRADGLPLLASRDTCRTSRSSRARCGRTTSGEPCAEGEERSPRTLRRHAGKRTARRDRRGEPGHLQCPVGHTLFQGPALYGPPPVRGVMDAKRQAPRAAGRLPHERWTPRAGILMMDTDPTLEALVAKLRANADGDVQFAQRVALACCALIETKVDATAAIRTTFRIQ